MQTHNMKILIFCLFLGSVISSPTKNDKLTQPDSFMHPDDPSIVPKAINEAEKTSQYWIEKAQNFIDQRLNLPKNTKKARNIIMFLGDGLSHPTIAATRLLLGGEEKMLSFEKFPYLASSVTYCTDVQVADSACTATAYLSGVKTNDGVIGLNARAKFLNCDDSNLRDKFTSPISEWAMDAGKWAGTVTTTRVTHASPAGTYAHTSTRDWEDDRLVALDGCDKNKIDDIAEQLVHGDIGPRLKVVLGGGARHFINQTSTEHNVAGSRRDGKNLINEWINKKPSRTFVRTKEELMNVDSKNVDQLLGLFASSHMLYHLETVEREIEDSTPTLKDMTLKAIDILDENPEGYFLFVEGGRIDHAHHETWTRLSLDETLEFHKAIEAAVDKVNLEETLIVVTADHSHAYTLGAGNARGGDVYGHYGTADDGFPYMVSSYANGPGYTNNRNADETERVDPRTLMEERKSIYYKFPATVPRNSETHGGDDVGIWAIGPWSHLFSRTIEQNAIPHFMAYASCIGKGKKMCEKI